MFGIEKDFQDIMEVIYGPLGKKKQMTEELDPSRILKDNDCIWYMGVKYKRVEDTQPFYDKLWGLLKTKIGNKIECDYMTDQVRDLIRENIPRLMENRLRSEYISGYNQAIEAINRRLFNGIQ